MSQETQARKKHKLHKRNQTKRKLLFACNMQSVKAQNEMSHIQELPCLKFPPLW